MSNNSSLYEAPCRGPFYFCVLYFFMAFFSNLDIFCRLFSIPYTTSAPHYSLYLLPYFLYSLCYFSVYLAYYSLFSIIIVCSIFLYTCMSSDSLLYKPHLDPLKSPGQFCFIIKSKKIYLPVVFDLFLSKKIDILREQ